MRIFSFGEEGEDSAIGVGAGGVLHDIEEVLAGNSFRVRDKAEFELRGVGLIEAEQILLSAGEAMARVQQRIQGPVPESAPEQRRSYTRAGELGCISWVRLRDTSLSIR